MLTYQSMENVAVSRLKRAVKILIIIVGLMAPCWIIIPGGCHIAQGAKPARLVGAGDTPQSVCFSEPDGWRCQSLTEGR